MLQHRRRTRHSHTMTRHIAVHIMQVRLLVWPHEALRHCVGILSRFEDEPLTYRPLLHFHFLGDSSLVASRCSWLIVASYWSVAGSRSHINSRTGQHALANNVSLVLTRGTFLSDPELGAWVLAGACSVGSLTEKLHASLRGSLRL